MYSYEISNATREQLITELLSFFDMPTPATKEVLPSLINTCKKSYDSKRLLKTAVRAYLDRIGKLDSKENNEPPESFIDAPNYDITFTPCSDDGGILQGYMVELPLHPSVNTRVTRILGFSEKYGLDRQHPAISACMVENKMKHYIIPKDDCKYEFQFYCVEESCQIRKYYKIGEEITNYPTASDFLKSLVK